MPTAKPAPSDSATRLLIESSLARRRRETPKPIIIPLRSPPRASSPISVSSSSPSVIHISSSSSSPFSSPPSSPSPHDPFSYSFQCITHVYVSKHNRVFLRLLWTNGRHSVVPLDNVNIPKTKLIERMTSLFYGRQLKKRYGDALKTCGLALITLDPFLVERSLGIPLSAYPFPQ